MNHPNIVKLKEVIREHDILYFVFEYMVCCGFGFERAFILTVLIVRGMTGVMFCNF